MKLNYSIDDLRLFWIVAQKGSFTKAAPALSMPISTLSRRINHLEASLQLRLLNRDAHRIILTGTGIQYFERCEALFNEFQSISTDLLKEKHEASGKIRITAPANMTHKWLGKILNDFLCEYPNINIDLTLSDKNIDIADQSIDLAFRAGSPNVEEWIARPLYQLKFILCASSKKSIWHSLKHPAELKEHPIILGKPMYSWSLLQSTSGECIEFTPQYKQIKFSADDIKVTSQAVVAQLGIGFLPDFIAEPLIAKGSLKQIMNTWHSHKREVYMLYRDRSNQPYRLRLLIDYILENCNENQMTY